MAIEIGTVRKLSNLARLELSEDQELKMSKDLGDILEWVEQLEEVDTENVDALGNVNEDEVPLRGDVADNFFENGETTKNAPESTDNYFVVPKVLS
ncbi:hypothetical protein BFP72_00015 [Reichenbachiella sp. 5M10]|uniref:Asp-tRNA(Asn)/Glu-tRNA(Gln) amidotransferase subunit GatC n=1 Tax=Reichenbachiella sp. 5M10 TaxID=1889772 RepID=UPI000C156132|nr:Asp-tRNA(Asn)/Glu-tRNA(Gln) amidotransferase subunit GatC [Reichenbachiella sp. 5M10]PIB33928.1 hypothetical protein BFP72_00015 [Reichenbachiella sp. 5M10]